MICCKNVVDVASLLFIYLFRILSIFNTHTERSDKFFFKETYSGVYPKTPNSWIYSTRFKPLLLTFIFQCEINPLSIMVNVP